MDNKTQNILQKFSKQKVDLSLITKVRALNKEQERIEKKFEPLILSAESKLKELDRSMDEWLSNSREWNKLYDEIERYEKELGIKTEFTRINREGSINQVNRMKKAISTAIKQITTI